LATLQWNQRNVAKIAKIRTGVITAKPRTAGTVKDSLFA